MPLESPIGIDSLKLNVPYYKIKKTSHNFLLYPEPMMAPDKKKKKKLFDVLFDTGEIMECGRAEINNDNRENIQYTLNAGGIFSKMNVPNIAGNRLNLGGTDENKKAIQFIYDSWNDAGIIFNRADVKISRLDMARDIETDYPPETYYPFLDSIKYSRINYKIGSTKYTGGKDKITCIYNKINELEEKAKKNQIKFKLPDEMQGKNQLRIEHRFLDAAGLKSAYVKKVLKHLECNPENLQDLSVLINEKKFRNVQGLHLAYNNLILSSENKNQYIKDNKKEIDLYVYNMSLQGYSPAYTFNRLLYEMLQSKKLGFDYDIDSFADTYFSAVQKDRKQKKSNFKRSIKKKYESAIENKQITYNELYQEIKEKALLKVA